MHDTACWSGLKDGDRLPLHPRIDHHDLGRFRAVIGAVMGLMLGGARLTDHQQLPADQHAGVYPATIWLRAPRVRHAALAGLGITSAWASPLVFGDD